MALNEGPLPETLQDEALSLSETLGPVEKGVDWPLIGKSGNLASLMSMVSGHEVGVPL